MCVSEQKLDQQLRRTISLVNIHPTSWIPNSLHILVETTCIFEIQLIRLFFVTILDEIMSKLYCFLKRRFRNKYCNYLYWRRSKTERMWRSYNMSVHSLGTQRVTLSSKYYCSLHLQILFPLFNSFYGLNPKINEHISFKRF